MKTLHLAIMVAIGIMVGVSSFNSTLAQNETNSTNSIPPNAIRTPNGGWVTPQTQTANGTKLNIHYEVGKPVYGTVPPPVPNFITQYMLSPLWQFKSGIVAKNVVCANGLTLVIKAEGGSPACVKPDTANILIKRGWASSIIATPPTVQQTSGNATLPASFMPCDTPFPKSNTDVAVLYMPVNSIGKLCVRYSNFNDFPASIYPPRMADPNNNNQNAANITIWSDLVNNTVSKGNLTVVYWIKTGNQTGFYGLTVSSCVWTPFAVGYNNNSRIVASDFPFVGVPVSCPAISTYSQIDSLSGIGVKYIPYP